MQAIGIVLATLLVLAAILFGTDHLDRRLGAEGPARDRLRRRAARHALAHPPPVRPGPACRDTGPGPMPVVHGRTAGPHGPLAVPTTRTRTPT